MFTGLVEGIGTVRSALRAGRDMVLTVVPPFDTMECKIGDSIAIDGVCLTVTDIDKGALSMDVSAESLSRSTLGRLKQGDRVNMERALKLNDRLGGHFVLGHVDAMGKIIRKQPRENSWTLRISMDSSLTRYTVEKGSIAIDGVSLTINKCFSNAVEVNIIPRTGVTTTLLKKGVGDLVNIETDVIGKYIERLMQGVNNKPTSSNAPTVDSKIFEELVR